jgi:threonine/homoserine/homoserine lactone efflux protein
VQSAGATSVSRGMDNSKTPRWLVVLLALLALFFLGPPLLAIALGAVGVLLALSAMALKVGVVVGAVYLAWRLLKVLTEPRPSTPVRLTAESLEESLEREERARKAALDLELEQAIRQSRATP